MQFFEPLTSLQHLSDEELQRRYKETRDEIYLQALYNRYKNLINYLVNYYHKIDSIEGESWAIEGFRQAVEFFNPKIKNFKAFLKTCVCNKLRSSYKRIQTIYSIEKQESYINSFDEEEDKRRFDKNIFHIISDEEVFEDGQFYEKEKELDASRILERIREIYREHDVPFTLLEEKVLTLILNGCDYKQIAYYLGLPYKMVSNFVQKMRLLLQSILNDFASELT